jgi:hypothetical protein
VGRLGGDADDISQPAPRAQRDARDGADQDGQADASRPGEDPGEVQVRQQASAPRDFTAFFRRWYGPTLKAFDALSDSGRAELEADLNSLAGRWDRNGDGGSVAIPATYLETVITLR